jgi:hypothetical protein
MMNWKEFGTKRSWPNFKVLNGIFLEGLIKPMQNLSQDSQFLGRDLNLGPPKYEGVLTIQP